MKQLKLFKNTEKAYGGTLLKTRKGREHGRPLSVSDTMHLVLRSSKAVGKWSFRLEGNRQKVRSILNRFATKYGVRIISVANVGNHLHIHLKLGNRYAYRAFIRAVTAAIAMAITGVSRWKKIDGRFWDYRPFTRVVVGWRAFLTLRDYVRINQFEGSGTGRVHAECIVKNPRWSSA